MQKKLMKEPYSHKWRALALLSITLILSMSTWFSASAVLPQLRDLWQISPGKSAWLTISVQIGFVFGALFSSLINLSDILPAKYVILIGSIGSALANGFLSVAGGVSLSIALRFATGFFLAGVYPPAFKLLSTWFQKDRGQGLGILAAALVLGNGVPHLVNALGGLDWKVVIYTTSALTVFGGLIVTFFVQEGPHPFPTAKFNPKQIKPTFTNRGVRLATLGYIGHMWELFAMYAWFSLFIREILATKGVQGEALAALASFAIFIAGSLGSWMGGILSDRWDRIKTTILMLSISGSCAILIGLLFNAPLWLVLLMSIIWGISIVADSAQFSTLVTEMADQSYVGTTLTLQLALGFSITVVTIWLIPLLVETIGWRWAFSFLAPGSAFGILAMLRLKSYQKTQERNCNKSD